jgi:hypothetical protein
MRAKTGMRFSDEFQRQLTYIGAAVFIVAFWWAFGALALWVFS